MNVNGMKLTAAAVAVAATFSAGVAFSTTPFFGHAHAASESVAVASSPSATLTASLPDMSTIVAQNGPAVVNISVSGTRKISNGQPDQCPRCGRC